MKFRIDFWAILFFAKYQKTSKYRGNIFLISMIFFAVMKFSKSNAISHKRQSGLSHNFGEELMVLSKMSKSIFSHQLMC